MRIPFLLSLFLLYGLRAAVFSADFPVVQNGVLDLSKFGVNNSNLIALDGDWSYEFGTLIPPGSADSSWKRFFRLPAPWNGTTLDGKVLGPSGSAAYRLKLILPPREDLVMGFKIPSICLSYRFYVNGRLVSQAGVPSTNLTEYRPFWKADTFTVNMHAGANELVFHVANYGHVHGGIEYSILFGTARAIQAEREARFGLDIFLIGALLIMGIYHLALFALRRKDFSALHFGLFCLLIALRTSLTGEKILLDIFPGISFELESKFEYMTIPSAFFFFQAYVNVLFPKETFRIQNWVSLGSSIGMFLLMLFTPESVYGAINPWYNLLMIAITVFILVTLVRAMIRRREGAQLLSLGFLVIALSVVNDILYVNQIIATGFLVPFGVFLFIFSQSFLLSRRFSRAFAQVEEMSVKLSRNSEDLEKTVAERTRELSEERNRLKQRNEIMEGELELARKIQNRLIPTDKNIDRVGWFYQPTDAVGGDFFDFIRFREKDMLGIFISDVSGHGVPAALVTSMIKSNLLKVAPSIKSASWLMEYLNDALMDRTAGHFVTAFYGIWNRNTREFIYCNAGHNLPYLLSEGIISELGGKRSGIPLAVVGNDALAGIGKPYFNESVIIPEGSKLLLYTDGLTETIRLSDDGKNVDLEDFGKLELFATMKELEGRTSAEFVEGISARLVGFRGGVHFDDDVCMVCLEA